jgi:hypothetical protein
MTVSNAPRGQLWRGISGKRPIYGGFASIVERWKDPHLSINPKAR